MMRISRRREYADRPVETAGYDGTKSAFADCALPPSRRAGRVVPHRIGDDVRRVEVRR
jgi:hypothetical protein